MLHHVQRDNITFDLWYQQGEVPKPGTSRKGTCNEQFSLFWLIINVHKRTLVSRSLGLSSQSIVIGAEVFHQSHLFVTGEEIFSSDKACEEEQGSVVNPRDRSDDEHNAETWKKIEPGRLFGVIWSSE